MTTRTLQKHKVSLSTDSTHFYVTSLLKKATERESTGMFLADTLRTRAAKLRATASDRQISGQTNQHTVAEYVKSAIRLEQSDGET